MKLRKATKKDYEGIWNIFSTVISTGDTYVFDPKTDKETLQQHWFAPYMDTFVLEENGEILGTYIIKPNQIDLGNKQLVLIGFPTNSCLFFNKPVSLLLVIMALL